VTEPRWGERTRRASGSTPAGSRGYGTPSRGFAPTAIQIRPAGDVEGRERKLPLIGLCYLVSPLSGRKRDASERALLHQRLHREGIAQWQFCEAVAGHGFERHRMTGMAKQYFILLADDQHHDLRRVQIRLGDAPHV